MTTFREFKLPPPIQSSLDAMGFINPTPIQQKAIPIALEGKDIVGCAQTGTGKTAAFCIPILMRLMAAPGKTALVLVPTRELAVQIDTFWQKLTAHNAAFRSVVIVGGLAMHPQISALKRKPRFIIATPGRMLDHLKRRTTNLTDLTTLVLDEADRMLDMGFDQQLSQILKFLPSNRQTLFFTATWQSQLDRLAGRYLRNPERVTVGTVSQAAPKVKQELVMTSTREKNQTLLKELKLTSGSVLVFARTKSRTDRVAKYLLDCGLSVNRIHGGRSQGQRNSALLGFRNGQTRVLVATDIAARGIDVTGIAHVVNYDLPQCSDDYIHRIGRTGRAGASGRAVSLLTPEDKQQWLEIARLLGRTGSEVPTLAQEFQAPKGRMNAPAPSRAKPRHERRWR